VRSARAAGEHDGGQHGEGAGLRAQPLQHLEAVAAREHHVEDHEVGRFFEGREQRLFAVVGGAHLEPLGAEGSGEDLTQTPVVVDAED
jgi:hypothetical protein